MIWELDTPYNLSLPMLHDTDVDWQVVVVGGDH